MAQIVWKSLGALGVEVEVDAARAFDEGEKAQLRQLYRDHHLLVLHGQALDRAQQEAFVGIFGDVIVDDPSGIISNVRRDVVGQNELVWHSDLIYTPEPHLGLSLYAVTADPGVVPTRFIDVEATLARLPVPLRARIEGLRALHVSGGTGGSARNLGDMLAPGWPRHVRPLVETNSQTGRPFLAVTLSQTSHVLDVDRAESDALLDALLEVLYDPAAVVEHHWTTGDLIVWDNLALQHSRDQLQGSGRRDLERVTFGGRTIFEQYPEWIATMRETLDRRAGQMM